MSWLRFEVVFGLVIGMAFLAALPHVQWTATVAGAILGGSVVAALWDHESARLRRNGKPQ